MSLACLAWLFYNLANNLGAVLPLVCAAILGGLFSWSCNRTTDRQRQIEINDRLARLEELRTAPPAAAPHSIVPEGYERKLIAGHLVDVPMDPPARAQRLTDPHQRG